MVSWKRNVTSGLITLGPILILIYIIYRLYNIIVGISPEMIFAPELLRPWLPGDSNQVIQTRNHVAAFLRVVLSLVLFCTITIAVGYLMRTTLGSLVEQVVDNVANRVPGLRIVYNASKIAAETTFGKTKQPQAPVHVETWNNHRMTAFKTGKQTDDGREILFLPTAPNFTSGFIIEVEPNRITETNESIEEALTRVISAGFGDATDDPQTGSSGLGDMLNK